MSIKILDWFRVALSAAALVFAALLEPAAAEAPGQPPNILVVLFDDVGFTDFGVYGSDSKTPNIDALARSGAQLTRYYTSPLCGPSRASLMTGQDAHLVGAATLTEVLTEEMRQQPAYRMTWDDEQKTIASYLKQEGYQTFVAGKWGIGDIGANLPNRFGFDRSWVLDATGSSNYSTKSYLPIYKEAKWFEDGERTSLPDDFYSSRDIVDKMIHYLDEAESSKPFFGYLAFTALHIPIQVPVEFIDKYNGVFDRGWDVMRQQRAQRAVDLGLVPEGTQTAPTVTNHREWDSLSDKEKSYWARAMQVNAGMIEAADYHLGRLLAHLRAEGLFENTIVVVTSDNGPEYNTLGKTAPSTMRAFENLWMAVEGWDTDYDNLGQRGSMAAIGHEWASVSAAPFDLFKFNASEGGLRVPMVIAGPGVTKRGLIDAPAQVSDVAPTLLSLAKIDYASDAFYGRTLSPLLSGDVDTVYTDNDVIAFEVSGASALYRGDWKIRRVTQPFGSGDWKLFNILSDPGESADVAHEYPAVLSSLLDSYATYADNVGVFELPPGESSRGQLSKNMIKKTAVNYWYLLLAPLSGIMLMLYVVFRLLKSS